MCPDSLFWNSILEARKISPLGNRDRERCALPPPPCSCSLLTPTVCIAKLLWGFFLFTADCSFNIPLAPPLIPFLEEFARKGNKIWKCTNTKKGIFSGLLLFPLFWHYRVTLRRKVYAFKNGRKKDHLLQFPVFIFFCLCVATTHNGKETSEQRTK